MAKTAQKTKERKSKKKNVKMDAKSHLEQALKINPDFLDAHYELGCLLRDEGDKKGAEKFISNKREMWIYEPSAYVCIIKVESSLSLA